MVQANSPALYEPFGVTAPMVVTELLQGAAPVTAANYGQFFHAPYRCVLREVRVSWRTASSSGTLQVERLQGTEAKDAGNDLLAATVDTSATAETVTVPALTTTTADLTLEVGDRLGLVNGGTLTSSADLAVTVVLTPIP